MFLMSALDRMTTIISRGRLRPNSLTWSMVIGGLPPRMIPSTRAAAASALRGSAWNRPAASRSFVVPIGATCDVWRAMS